MSDDGTGRVTLAELTAEANAIGRALCADPACWVRGPHYHAELPERARVDCAVTAESVVFRPIESFELGPSPSGRPTMTGATAEPDHWHAPDDRSAAAAKTRRAL